MTDDKIELQPIHIECDRTSWGGGTKVYLGELRVRRVKNVRFSHKVGEAPMLHLDVIALDGVTVDGKALVDVTDGGSPSLFRRARKWLKLAAGR